jgi:hypothetical protein
MASQPDNAAIASAVAAGFSAVAGIGAWFAVVRANKIAVTVSRNDAMRDVTVRVDDLLVKAQAGITGDDARRFRVFMSGILHRFPPKYHAEINDLARAVKAGQAPTVSGAISESYVKLQTSVNKLIQL